METNKFIQYTWELPQNIVGVIIKHIFKATPYTTYKDATVYSWSIKGGLSLGKHIFIPFKDTDSGAENVQEYIKHEYGHTEQSKRLGWLYLPVIVLPSLVWAGYFKWYKKTNKSYYWFYTEKWADKLGGVER